MVGKPLIVIVLFLHVLTATSLAQSDGYFGYSLNRRGDEESAIYQTENTSSGVPALDEDPDVYLNASVSVGEISIEVQNLTAKVDLDAQVLNLLKFNAGVDASINRVKLGIYNVSAKVELEARLGNVVRMIGSVLDSIDLNPVIATLGDGLSDIVDGVGGVINGDGDGGNGGNGDGEDQSDEEALKKRSLAVRLEQGILYSVNNFSGRTHTNRILAQNGSIVDIGLDNRGVERRRRVVGYYSRDMTFTGHNRTITTGDEIEHELQYLYAPYTGLEAYCNIYLDRSGGVVRTKIVAEAEGGGSATISGT